MSVKIKTLLLFFFFVFFFFFFFFFRQKGYVVDTHKTIIKVVGWYPASLLSKYIADRYRLVSYPDGPITDVFILHMLAMKCNLTELSDWRHPSILHKSTPGRYRPVRVADGPITVRYRFIKNASWDIECLDWITSVFLTGLMPYIICDCPLYLGDHLLI